jgi:glycosyltransferase involved in cell wall biosynthesis
MSFENRKVLILIPGPNARGGITGYYQTLKKYFSLNVDYFERGSRNWPNRDRFLSVMFHSLIDTYNFYKKLKTKQYDLVQTTTSFSSFSIIRDSLFVLIAYWLDVKIIVFFHGWVKAFADIIEAKYIRIFKSIYFKSNAIIDLSQANKEKLIEWGYNRPIFIETTVVDAELLKGFNLNVLENKHIENSPNQVLLFMARIEKEKGIYEAIDTYAILKRKHHFLQMIIAGDGKEDLLVKEYVAKLNLLDIIFTGFVNNPRKKELLINSQIYILPSYSEGMPTTVLEAMAFGLPVITRPVGGIPDIFKNGINGFYDESKDPIVFAGLIEKLLINKPLMKEIAFNNYNYAQERFLSDKVVKRIENIFNNTLNS